MHLQPSPSIYLGNVYLEQPQDFSTQIHVVGCFVEYLDRFLLLHRQDHKSEGNMWGVPGGKLDKNEDPIDGAIRETFEETGIQIDKKEMTYLKGVYIRQPQADFIYHMVKTTFHGNPAEIKIAFSEHKGFTWATPEQALKMDLMLDEDVCVTLIYPARAAS